MISFNRLLTVSYLAIILIGVAIAAPLAWIALEQSYLENQRANLLAQAELIAQSLQASNQTQLPAVPYTQQTNTFAGIHTHIIELDGLESTITQEQSSPSLYTTMIAEDGPVLIGLQSALPQAQQVVSPLPSLAQNASGNITSQELLSRSEISAAFSGQSATAVRTLYDDKRVLYASAPIVFQNGEIAQIVYIATPLPNSGWAALPTSTRQRVMGIMALMVVVTGIIGWQFSQHLAQPLSQIVVGANQVAKGDLNSHVSTQSKVTDLQLLSQSFNEMTKSLRRADQAKVAFVADVSHELRTPLTVIKGTVETLQDGAIDDFNVRDEFLDSIDSETERLIDLVNGLLTLARADSGALKLRPTSFNLAELAQTRVDYIQRVAVQKGINLQLDVAAVDDCWVLADELRITQVLDNLLDNAIRYSQSGDKVQVIMMPNASAVDCSVIDNGLGIAAEHLPFLFDRFYRVEASRNRRLGGSGLGLSICREIIEAHDGSIEVESIEGDGATFTFTLPMTET